MARGLEEEGGGERGRDSGGKPEGTRKGVARGSEMRGCGESYGSKA